MYEVAICSLVRNGIDYLHSFRRQLESLNDDIFRWHLYLIEGDSLDASWEFIKEWAEEDRRITIRQFHVGKATERESIAERWANVGNKCIEMIPANSTHTHVMWLEADLCFPPELIRRLLNHNVDIVSPIIFLGGLFYDTWGFRGMDGKKWTNHAPYHPEFLPMTLLPMHSVGSCVLFARKVMDVGIRFKGTHEDGLLVGICNDARRIGMAIYADTSTAILHPVDNWEKQLWHLQGVKIVDSKAHEPDILDFKDRGASPAIPILDASFLIQAHFTFLQDLFGSLGTNHIRIEIEALSKEKRNYKMVIHPLEQTGIWKVPILGKRAPHIARLVSQIHKSWSPIRTGETKSTSILACVCHVQVNMVK